MTKHFNHLRQLLLCLVLMIMGGSLATSCRNWDNVETRLKASIKWEGEREKYTPRMRKASDDILAVLKSSTKDTLENPKICAAFIGKEKGTKETNYRLFIFWAARSPTANAVELNLNGITVTNRMEQFSIDANRMEAQEKVVFYEILNWNTDTALWPELEKLKVTGDLRIRLLNEKEPVTDYFTVDVVSGLYRSGPSLPRVIATNSGGSN